MEIINKYIVRAEEDEGRVFAVGKKRRRKHNTLEKIDLFFSLERKNK